MLKTSISVLALACMTGLPGMALAGKGDDTVIDADFTRRPAGSTSGSGDTVEAYCPPDPSGNAWQGATATLEVSQSGHGSKVEIEVRNAVPDTVFTVWLRMAASGPGDENGAGGSFGGSPLTGGGATPLVPGYALDKVAEYSPPFAGSANPTNGFTTDGFGNADFEIELDFPLVGGAYPFQAMSDDAVNLLRGGGSTWPLERKPSPVANPADPSIGGPFLLRVISHCQDGVGHGLSPAQREAWFQYP